MWKAKTPFERQAAAAEYWLELRKAEENTKEASINTGVDKGLSVLRVLGRPGTAAAGAALLGTFGAVREYQNAIPRVGGKSRYELIADQNERNANEVWDNEGVRGGTFDKARNWLQRERAREARERPLRAAFLASTPWAAAGAAVGTATYNRLGRFAK